MNHGVPAVNSGLLWTRASSRTQWIPVCTVYVFVCVRVCERSRERAMRRIWEPCSFVGEKGVCTVCFPTLYIFVYPHLQIAVSVDASISAVYVIRFGGGTSCTSLSSGVVWSGSASTSTVSACKAMRSQQVKSVPSFGIQPGLGCVRRARHPCCAPC